MEVDDLETRPVAGPRPIQQLSQDVVNKIAAAEIIHRPSNAIKELLENSLDAGSTSIKVTAKDGGLKSMMITDNGHGIRKEDLPLLCQRFATSKLRAFSDLQSLNTYGFRGEALASISFVSRVSVITKTAQEPTGWKAHYSQGKLVAPNGAGSADPRPSAANQGTIITVSRPASPGLLPVPNEIATLQAEDLFYDVPLRRKSFKSGADEYNRIIDVVTRYAVHNPHVAWVCKKHGTNQPEVSTASGSNCLSNIGLLYGSALSRELLAFGPAEDKKFGIVKVHGYASGAGHNGKKGILLLFINNRLVESNKFRKAIEALYTAFLPKGSYPFVYLSLEIEPHRVDVNVHPTKSEVHFLDEDAVVELVMNEISKALANANASRSYSVQTLLPGASEPNVKPVERDIVPRVGPKTVAPQHKVRIDPSDRKLESMSQFAKRNPDEMDSAQTKRRKTADGMFSQGVTVTAQAGSIAPEVQIVDLEDEEDDIGLSRNIIETTTSLKSIKKLRQLVEKNGDARIDAIFAKHKFVGVTGTTTHALIQYETKLYMIHYGHFARELFYQLGLRQFGAYGCEILEPALDIRELLTIAVDAEEELSDAGLDPEDIIESTANLLVERKEMLEEYFSMKIDDQGRLVSLPTLLPGYGPPVEHLPFFMLCLGQRVDWNAEQACFDTFLRELARFYAPSALHDTSPTSEQDDADMPVDDTDTTQQQRNNNAHEFARHQLEHVLFPAMRRYAKFPKDSIKHITELADVKALYRIFERC